ncbi:polyhydroxyalkanoic acid system family protein [Craterilacuibacter sp.]|uniref:polyhydroxyalkanoic acid system family protein n=1 Tax=Craterilacuibacter sp. TaxID=2870909 RepID=UPI003F3D8973
MSDILVIRRHDLDAAQAKQAAEAVARQLQQEHALEYAWEGEFVLRFERSGVSGSLLLDEGSVTVRVRLGWLLSPFRHSLQQEIHRYFDQQFSKPE